jgi:CheY-like chemotaxis protein/two-component sensor histidine kinase
LIDDLLDVNRIGRGKVDLRRERIDLATVVADAVNAARPLCDQLTHALSVSLPEHPIFVHGDLNRLTQVIGNLLDNACKFTPPGGQITLTVSREGETAVVGVRDNGIGIAADQLAQVFEMFVQADTSLERAQSGLGLGLTLAKSLVEMHGGTIEGRSEGVGHGTELIVRLPVLSEEPGQPVMQREQLQTEARRILVVDDNRDSADSLALLLELSGHTVRAAYDGLEAVELAGALQPEVILLDIGLPKLNGYEAARRIRAFPAGARALLIALTGWGQEADRRRSEEAGFNAHLVKPLNHAALMQLLAEWKG